MSVIARRKGEPLDEAARRVATDALYAARDNGGTMHDAGAAAGDAVSSLYAGAVAALKFYADPATWDHISARGTVTTNTPAARDSGERARRALGGQ